MGKVRDPLSRSMYIWDSVTMKPVLEGLLLDINFASYAQVSRE